MFRGPQILTWSCPIRPLLLLLRESHLFALSEHPGAGWQGARAAQERRYKGVRGCKEGSTRLFSFSSDCEEHQLRENLPSKAILSGPPQVSVSDSGICTVVEDLGQNLKAVSTYQDCLTRLQPWRRPWDKRQPSLSLSYKTRFNPPQSHLHCRRHFVRPLCLSTPCVSNHFHSRPQPSSLSFHQTRAAHQAALHVVESWRDCLSPENETRCRQSLGPNLKLYEVGGKGASPGKNRGKWASVLVSLCSVEGEPAFLFTLRSSTLKGRHKGDVSFAGGKSDPADRDVVTTALREAREELGVNVGTEKVWGVLKPLRDMSGMMIAPVLANLGPLEELSFKPNPGEVEEIFTLSLSHLCNPQNRGYTHFRTGDKYGYTLPVFRNGKHRVWGLTAIALDHTLKLIVPP